MRLCPTKELTEGMVIGKSLYQENGKLLLGAGFRVNATVKAKLMDRKYPFIYIMEDGTDDIVPEDVISDEVRMQAAAVIADKNEKIQKFFQFQEMTRSKIEDSLKKGYLKDLNISKDVHQVVEEILKDVTAAGVRFLSTTLYKSEDTYFLDHAINTTVLAVLIGKKYLFTTPEIIDLAVGSFLHDFGKIIIDKMNASHAEKREDLYREHPTFGYLLLHNSHNVSPIVTQIVNQHHEYQNGSGFPVGLRGQNLPPTKIVQRETKGMIYRLAEICCVVNEFDNMVMNPLAEKKLDIAEAMRELILGAGKKYNKDIVAVLHAVVPYFPLGSTVRIKRIFDPTLIGYRGVVAKLNEEHLNKPLIILLHDRMMKKINPRVLDTSKLRHVELELII
jgi:HD-GYP domain-containing protein (c-di-GMP phosphodiesterase class II)